MTELLEMKFYKKVDTNYLNELRKIDGRVPLNKGNMLVVLIRILRP